MNIQVMDYDEITDTNCNESSSSSSTMICYLKCESIFGPCSCLKGIIIKKAKTGDSNFKDSNFNKMSGKSALIGCKKNESISKLSSKEVNFREAETGDIDIRNSSFSDSSDSLFPLICPKNENSLFKSSLKRINLKKTRTGNIDFKNSNLNESSGSLSASMSKKNDDSIFKSSPKEDNFRKTRSGYFDIKIPNSKELSDLIYHEENDSTFESNSADSLSVSRVDASSANIKGVKSYSSETDLYLEAENSNSGTICSLSEEECVKVLFHDEWKTDDDSSDDITDDELEERLLSFDDPLEYADSQTNQNFRMIKNETLKRKRFCDLKNEDEDGSLLKNEKDKDLDRSKRVCLHNNYGDVASIVLDKVFLVSNYQNLRPLFYKEDPIIEILEFLNRNINDEKKINSNVGTPSIMAGDMLAEKMNHTPRIKENSNGNMVFSWMAENIENNLDRCSKYDIKEYETSQNDDLGHFKSLFHSEEIKCNSPLFPLDSLACKEQPHENNCIMPNSSLSELSGCEIQQISLNAERKKDKTNTFDPEYCFEDSDEPCPNLFVRSSIGRKYFWEYLKHRTESLCATYEKIKNEIILSSHIG